MAQNLNSNININVTSNTEGIQNIDKQINQLNDEHVNIPVNFNLDTQSMLDEINSNLDKIETPDLDINVFDEDATEDLINIVDLTDEEINNINNWIEQTERLDNVFDGITGDYEDLSNIDLDNINIDEGVEVNAEGIAGAFGDLSESAEELSESAGLTDKQLTNLAKEFNILGIKVPGTNKSLGQFVRLFKSGGAEAVALVGSITAVIAVLTAYTKLLNNAISATKKFVSTLASSSWKAITSGFNSLVNGLKSGISSIGQMFGQITNYVINSTDLSNIAGVATSLGDDMVNALKGDVQESSLLYQIMTENQRKALLGLENETQRYNYLVSQSGSLQAQYAAYLNTINGKLLGMKSAFIGVSQTITAFARNVLAVLAPVLTTIANFVNGILQVLGRLLHFDMSGASKIGSIGGSLSDGFNQAKKAAEDYQKSASKSTKKAAKDTKKAAKDISKAIEEAKRQTLSFDDVIQISDTSKDVSDIDVLDDLDDLDLDNIAGGVGDVADALADLGGSLDLPGMELPKWLQDLLDLLSNKEFFKFGAGIADALADILRKVPWDEIREKAEALGKGLAEFFNGLFSSKSNWETFGYSLAQVFNKIASALKGFLDEFNFKQAGTSIGAFFAKMFDSVDTETVGHDIYKVISGAFEFAINFLAENPVLKGLNMVARIISQAFSEWTEEDTQNVANSLVMFIKQALRGITNIIGSIDFSVVNDIITAFFDNMQAYLDDTGKGDIKRLLNTVVNGISELLGDGNLAEKIIGVANTVLDTLIEWLNNGGDEKLAKIGDAIVSFLDKLRESGLIQKIGDVIRRILGDIRISDILNEVMMIQIQAWWEEQKTKFAAEWKSALTLIWEILTAANIPLKLKEWADENAEVIANMIRDLLNLGIPNLIKIGGKFIENAVNGILKALHLNVQISLDNLFKLIEGVWKNIQGIFKNITDGIKEAKKEWENSKIGQMVSGIKIPWLNKATGGITNGPSIGLVGEAGREAILPLENNTGWMDILANKISGINGGGGNTQNITIDFSSLNKPFYSRAELIEMGQVINDSLNAYNFGTT